MKRRIGWRGACGLMFALLVWTASAAGEELTLKDGKKIVGTIVGYEEEMFRVETEFGYALVRKDRVATINLNAPGPRKGEEKRETSRKPTSARPPAVGEKPELPSAIGTGDAATETAAAPPAAARPAPTPPSRALDEPLPAQIQEHLEGATYVNDTFQFAMYKPPGWKIFEGASKETGRAIVAIGTEDERTLLVVDRQVWSGAPDLKSDAAERTLRQTYQNFQKLAESPAQIDGRPALRRVFKGEMDNAEWHGASTHVARGNQVFGIIGLTSAEAIEFHRAVLNKVINSFRFLSPSAGASPPGNPTP